MSDPTENVNEDNNEPSKKAVTGSLLGALGFMEGSTPEPEPSNTWDEPVGNTPTPKEEEPPAPGIPMDPPLDEPAPGVVLSAKDLKITQAQKNPVDKIAEVPEPKPVETPAADPEPKPADTLEGLAPNERETVELLQFGETKEIAKKGVSGKLVEYYKKRGEILATLTAENEFEEDYDPKEDPKYSRWLRANKPPVDVKLLEDIRTEKILTTAEDRALERFRSEQKEKDEKWDEAMREQKLNSVRPQIERTVDDFADQLLAEMPEEVTSALKAGKKWDVVEEESPIEAPIVKSVLNEFRDRAEILVSIYEGVTPINPSNAVQASLISFIKTQADLLSKQPVEKTQRGGKRFVKPQEFNGDDGTWTFTQGDVLTMLRKAAVISTNDRISVEKKKYDAYTKRLQSQAPYQNGVATPRQSSPQVRPSSSGSATPAPKQAARSLFSVLAGD